ncbi:MAG: cytochrome c maturation protein CcmE [Pseudomonadota bacterium]
MTRKQWRLTMIGGGVTAFSIAVALMLYALSDTIVLFYTPSDLNAGIEDPTRTVRLGGLVAEGSVVRGEGQTVRFDITDTAQSVEVRYTGILPDLFREGQGIVAQGRIGEDGIFRASQVLAKHDENYLPPEAAEAIERAGQTLVTDE